jgi:hypothetical protein
MTRHALQTHCPNSGLFAVSSLGRSLATAEGAAPGDLHPAHLEGPLGWLATALQTQDEARLERLWSLAAGQVSLLGRGVEAFAYRYPEAAATAGYRRRLRELRRRQRQRRGLVGTAAAACLLGGLWTYDALGYQRATRFEADHTAEPAAALRHWEDYRFWHPTRLVLGPGSSQGEEERLRELKRKARQAEGAERLADLRRRAANPDADPETLWARLHDFAADYPEASVLDLQPLREEIKLRRDDQVRRKARCAYDELVLTEQRVANLTSLVAQADRFLRDFPGSPEEQEVQRRRDAYLLRLDGYDIEAARNYSARQPLDFEKRRELYQRYLDKHAGGGAFAKEAEAALRDIATEWDKHDFRPVRDHFEAKPGEIAELVSRCRGYLAMHPQGQFAAAATELLRWSERVTTAGEYRVTLNNGEFERGVARFFSRGPKLSVELEVNGVYYGPSTITRNRYDPEWDYEFPRRVRWKLGEPVRIRVTDHTWKDRVVFEAASADGDPLGLRLLTGEVWSGRNHVTFESDFALPVLPKVE